MNPSKRSYSTQKLDFFVKAPKTRYPTGIASKKSTTLNQPLSAITPDNPHAAPMIVKTQPILNKHSIDWPNFSQRHFKIENKVEQIRKTGQVSKKIETLRVESLIKKTGLLSISISGDLNTPSIAIPDKKYAHPITIKDSSINCFLKLKLLLN